MIRSLYTATSAMMVRGSEQFDMYANNLANVGTPGFKAQYLSQISVASTRNPSSTDIQVSYSKPYENPAPGQLQFTGVDLDLAVEGGAFFVVQTPSGETAYSRNGHLTRSPDGSILSASGTKVLGEKGPLRVPADAAKITVDAKGMVFADGAPVDRLRLVEFPAGAPAPRLVGGGILLGQEGGEPIPSQQMVRQGYFERSNVNVVEEMVRLVESTRSMESYQKMAVAASDETTGQLVRQTGRVA